MSLPDAFLNERVFYSSYGGIRPPAASSRLATVPTQVKYPFGRLIAHDLLERCHDLVKAG
jgi:hypothetical protein